MSSAPGACPNCGSILLVKDWINGQFSNCPSCDKQVRYYVYPAIFRAKNHIVEHAEVEEGVSVCYYHPKKNAKLVCGRCGRFLCDLCDLEIESVHVCSNCLDKELNQGELKHIKQGEVMYDGVALALAFLPILLWPFTIITSPTALFFARRAWVQKKDLILPRSVRLKASIAMIAASLQVCGWIVLITSLIIK